jgi:prepilin-type N-terminal cleavage/methylation domain-containing protein
MFIARVDPPSPRLRRAGPPSPSLRRAGFTLLEIVIAVAILGMMSLAIYRFVQTNIVALRVSSEMNVANAQYSGFANLIASEWQSLPPGMGAMLGEPLKLGDRSQDEISWISSAGPGLLTRYAAGEYQVSMRLRPVAKNSNQMEIGFARSSKLDAAIGQEEKEDSWVPLLSNVQSLQIRYFDPRLNTWVDKWSDTVTLPRLVKIDIGRANDAVPWEAIIPLGRTPL